MKKISSMFFIFLLGLGSFLSSCAHEFDYKFGYRTGYVRGSSLCVAGLNTELQSLPATNEKKKAALKKISENEYPENSKLGEHFVKGYNDGVKAGYQEICIDGK